MDVHPAHFPPLLPLLLSAQMPLLGLYIRSPTSVLFHAFLRNHVGEASHQASSDEKNLLLTSAKFRHASNADVYSRVRRRDVPVGPVAGHSPSPRFDHL